MKSDVRELRHFCSSILQEIHCKLMMLSNQTSRYICIIIIITLHDLTTSSALSNWASYLVVYIVDGVLKG